MCACERERERGKEREREGVRAHPDVSCLQIKTDSLHMHVCNEYSICVCVCVCAWIPVFSSVHNPAQLKCKFTFLTYFIWVMHEMKTCYQFL